MRKILCLYQVGSGKSSLLNSVIGETHVVGGSISSCGSIAYVPQVVLYDLKKCLRFVVEMSTDVLYVPWILSGSLRDNILLGKEIDPRR